MKKLLLLGCLTLLSFTACNKDDVVESGTLPPTIELDNPTAIYSVKSGRTLEIVPTYRHVDKALYAWSVDGKVIGQEPVLAFCEERIGEVFVSLRVSTPYGTATEELRVDVVSLEIPTVTLPGSKNGYTILEDSELKLQPEIVETSLETAYSWTVDGQPESTEREYTFKRAAKGTYNVAFTARNEDGSDSIEFTVRVCSVDEMPFSWTFEQTEYNLSQGRTVRLLPLDITNAFDAVYTWTVDGKTVQTGTEPQYDFTGTVQGTHEATVTMRNTHSTATQTLTVRVCPPAGTYYRAASAASRAGWTRVYEFLAAPGQFVNENYTAHTMEEACRYAESQMQKGTYVSLGGFGGYIVVGFDHSIDNRGGYDFAIGGNSFDGSSEPGIVWVMQDENGDGLPNDTWYELKGSETGKPETVRDYAVTYYRPRGAGMEVPWTDNRGNSGSIDYLPAYHRQDYYYPNWVEADSYTLRGTCLKSRNYDQSGNGTYWVNPAFDWGYADNFSPIDRLTDDPNASAGVNANHFKISNAIDFDGKPAGLKYIDFVKVQVGINAKSGWLGEISTEVFDFYDFNLQKK